MRSKRREERRGEEGEERRGETGEIREEGGTGGQRGRCRQGGV